MLWKDYRNFCLLISKGKEVRFSILTGEKANIGAIIAGNTLEPVGLNECHELAFIVIRIIRL